MLGFICKRAKFISNVHVAHLPILTFRKWVISLSNDSMHVIDRRSEKFPKSFWWSSEIRRRGRKKNQKKFYARNHNFSKFWAKIMHNKYLKNLEVIMTKTEKWELFSCRTCGLLNATKFKYRVFVISFSLKILRKIFHMETFHFMLKSVIPLKMHNYEQRPTYVLHKKKNLI